MNVRLLMTLTVLLCVAAAPAWAGAITILGESKAAHCSRAALFGRADGRYRTLPLASGWTRFRDFPAPQPGGTFHARWAKRRTLFSFNPKMGRGKAFRYCKLPWGLSFGEWSSAT